MKSINSHSRYTSSDELLQWFSCVVYISLPCVILMQQQCPLTKLCLKCLLLPANLLLRILTVYADVTYQQYSLFALWEAFCDPQDQKNFSAREIFINKSSFNGKLE